ncbi:DUF6475 domain-containing protein [Legionella sp.]|uniref:DUF6475 domain-containing protein n=1 Tax=Legionella sp. TaxID=459 RepID=UPI0032205309
MTPNEQAEFAKIMLICAEKYKRTFSHAFMELYWHSLKAFPLSEIKRAFETHFNNPDNGHFLPHQSDILRILQGDSETQAFTAWTKVMHAIAKVGAYHSIVFDDLLIHAVISDMGGWRTLCCQTTKELKFSGYEFQKRYGGYLLRRPSQYPNRLIGIIEHQNQQYDYTSPVLQLFGDRQAAKLTFEEGLEPAKLAAQKITSMQPMTSALINTVSNFPKSIRDDSNSIPLSNNKRLKS